MQEVNENTFRQRIQFLKDDLNSENPSYPERLKEKGTEICFIVPLLEFILGFDPVVDIKYEYTSQTTYDRFDFLVDGKLIIEAKKLNSPMGADIKKQLFRYIVGHDDIRYGILTNGAEYLFFIQKSFIREFLSPEETFKMKLDRDVFHVLTLSIFDKEFFDVIKYFAKNTYHDTFYQIARFAKTRINQTKSTKIVSDRKINTWMQARICEALKIRHGELLRDIEKGTIKVGQKLSYCDNSVSIEVTVLNDGYVQLQLDDVKVTDMMAAINAGFGPLVDLIRTGELAKGDNVFYSTSDIIKMALGRERLPHGKYQFS